MAEIRIEDPPELIDMVRPADVLRHAHAIKRGGLIDPIAIGDDQDRDLARQDRGRPEEPIELLQVAAVAGPMHHDEPRMGHGQQRARFFDGGRHDHRIRRRRL